MSRRWARRACRGAPSGCWPFARRRSARCAACAWPWRATGSPRRSSTWWRARWPSCSGPAAGSWCASTAPMRPPSWAPTGPGTCPCRRSFRSAGGPSAGLVHRTRAPARVADYHGQDDPGSRLLAALRYRGGVGAPITIGARLWGAVIAADRRAGALPRLRRGAARPLRGAAGPGGRPRRGGRADRERHRRRHLREPAQDGAHPAGGRRQRPAGPAGAPRLLLPPLARRAGPARPSSPPRRIRRCAPGSRPSPAGPSTPSPCGPCSWSRPDRVLVVEDARELPGDQRLARGMDVGSLIGVRLEHCSVRESPGGPMLGALFVSFCEPRSFSTRERAAARSLGSMASVAVANARLHAQTVRSLEEARERATLDPLTGLLNHRAFQERLAREVAPRPAARAAAVAGALRSRSLQAGQRHPRPPGRRRGAGGGGPAPVGRLAAGGRGGPDRRRGVRLAAARGRRARRPTWPPSGRARPSPRRRWGSPAR